MVDQRTGASEHTDIAAAFERHKEFVSILAHELKGPLTTIMGFGRTLEEHWETIEEERRVQFISTLRRETERLAQLVSDLLDMSGIENGGFRYEFAPMNIRDLLDSIVTIHEALFAGHRIKSEIPDDLPQAMADSDRVRQVLLNLIGNAVRYSPEGTTITIAAQVTEEADRPWVQVSVTDEGIGIAPEHRERIFSKFAMVPKPAWAQKGTGLGLFITKGIVEAHGGRLWVESQLGKGTTFYFTIPVAVEGDD